ncbi:unnamed protein product [Cladocopium goreaui]|uniref:Exportin-T (Exportin(tRNA)) (tRNA exportin) n=1 Tax=Cladocopium goreaui TaxID=2562237 RepID=A0A9P1BUG1_9DINO|nr:unnamed protein product [Cladocopium goreaui]
MRILVLHGYSGNALWQEKKDQKLQQLLAQFSVQLHHVDAPIQLPPFFSGRDPMQRRLSWWSLKRDDSWRRLPGAHPGPQLPLEADELEAGVLFSSR